METVNSKLLPDLEKYESEIYELKEQALALKHELKEKDRECYNWQQSLATATGKIALQQKVIEEAGAK